MDTVGAFAEADSQLSYAAKSTDMTQSTTKKLFDSPSKTRLAKFTIGQVVRHRLYPFRGIVFDIDPVFANTEEWYQSIPAERRPSKDQPFYHLFAENAESEYIAYVSEQNLLPDTTGKPVRHPQIAEVFERDEDGSYKTRNTVLN
jgi:heat shock protein HspQ